MQFNNEKLKKADYPIIEPDSEGKPLKERIIWKNFFKIRITDLLFIIAIIALLLTLKVSTHECKLIVEQPCTTAAQLGCDEINITIEKEKHPEFRKNKTFNLPNGQGMQPTDTSG